MAKPVERVVSSAPQISRGMSVIDPKTLRSALGNFATGVTIVTTCYDGQNIGLTANSFNSVSLDPPLVLWSLAKKSSNINAFQNGENFAVHILGSDQESLSNQFATPGIDKFAGVEFEVGRNGTPLLRNCAARFECRTAYRYDGGDHIILVGEILAIEQWEKEPLLFHRGKYARKTVTKISDADGNRRDLNYLVARAYFMLTDGIRVSAMEQGLTQVDHYALSVLLKSGPASVNDIIAMLSASGWEWTAADLRRLAASGLIETSEGGDISLTKVGRKTMIGLFAQAKAREADAQKVFKADDLDHLRSLLWQLLEGLEDHPVSASPQHLEVMNALQADQ